ncbi:MAG: hypothetical protein JXB50_10815 [Spirochaetes bacterium]|nr:hypothetical protein [Spirochaetota bacterium]
MTRNFFISLFIFLSFIFYFNCTPQAVVEDPPPADNIPPFMTSVSITPSTLQVTNSFTVSVGATDNVAGVYRIYCELEDPT